MTPYVECVDCGWLEEGGPCGKCLSARQRPAALRMSAKERKRMSRSRTRRRVKPVAGRGPALRTDTNWPRLGTIEPGFNHGQPLESRADFDRECREKGIELVSIREIKNASPRDNVREMQKEAGRLLEKYCHA